MNHFKMFCLAACLIIVAFFSSCLKEGEYPKVLIVSPVQDQLQQAQMVIEVYFSDAEGLEEARIEVVNTTNGSVFFEDAPMVKDSTGVLYTKVISLSNIDVPTTFTMQVDVKDKSDQYLLTKVGFTGKQ